MSTTLDISTGEAVRSRLDHPVIDVDGHLVEYLPPVEDYLKDIAGSSYELVIDDEHHPRDPLAEKWKQTRGPGVWWPFHTKNTLDRATSALPALLNERLDEIGLDYTILFHSSLQRIGVKRRGPVAGSGLRPQLDPELEQIRHRAFNAFRADLCGDFSDRMTPVAFLPMITPQAAIEELEYAVLTLGLKAVSVSPIKRPIPALDESHPELFPNVFWMDTFGLDSLYDYDPFWARCQELNVPVLNHGGSFGWTGRNSPTNAVYNHIGHCADNSEAMAKSLLLSGVTRRFPDLKFGFLECGVAWACRAYTDLIDRWYKRNRDALENYNPAHLDQDLFLDLHRKYGNERVQAHLDGVLRRSTNVVPDNEGPPDDFALAGIERPEDIRDLFVPNFFFGCEADDRTLGWAFDRSRLPFGVQLKPVLSSDIGHWDVPIMNQVLVEAYEQVQEGRLTPEELRAVTFGNAVDLLTGANPDFFKGTAIEDAVNEEKKALATT